MALLVGFITAIYTVFFEVICFWYREVVRRKQTGSLVDEWWDALRNAEDFEEWENAAIHLDSLKKLDAWRADPASHSYDWTLISDRLSSILAAREDNDFQSLVHLVRSGLVRSLGNITAPRLYNRSFAGTKYLIEEYIAQVAGAIDDINTQSSAPAQDAYAHGHNLSTQWKLDFLHDSRQAFGRSTLVLQGGAIFGLCHVGVVKALFLRGLLPRIITGSATGALIASLVAVHTEEELLGVLNGDGIDLSAFEMHEKEVHSGCQWSFFPGSGLKTLVRRLVRFWREGYFLDVKVLEDCVKANLGDLTFEEAFNRSKRVLNITVATEGPDSVPILLNYITAPNVIIWTAAVASNASAPSLYGSRQTTVLCKDVNGHIVPWAPATSFHPRPQPSDNDLKSPLARISQLFNVNHFIVSQARPYLVPFLESDMRGPSLLTAHIRRAQITGHLFRIVGLEVRHRLRQLDTLGLLPASIRRFLVDEEVAGASMVLVPDITASDFVRLLETPTRKTLDYWILRGERSVWPAVCALKVRCLVEYEIETAYQRVRRLKAGGLRRKASTNAASALVDPKPQPQLQAPNLAQQKGLPSSSNGSGTGNGNDNGTGNGNAVLAT